MPHKMLETSVKIDASDAKYSGESFAVFGT